MENHLLLNAELLEAFDDFLGQVLARMSVGEAGQW